MSDGAFLILAALVVTAFIVGVLASTPDPTRRNPHTDEQRPRWHTRRPR
jgi:hypothetical protein